MKIEKYLKTNISEEYFFGAPNETKIHLLINCKYYRLN